MSSDSDRRQFQRGPGRPAQYHEPERQKLPDEVIDDWVAMCRAIISGTPGPQERTPPQPPAIEVEEDW